MDYTGTITWHSKKGMSAEAFQEQFQAKTAATLEREEAVVKITGNRVSFTAGLFRRVGNWNVLAGITSGYLETQAPGDQVVVSYHFRCTPMLVMYLLFGSSTVFCVMISHVMHPVDRLIVLLMSPVTYSINYLVQTVRLPAYTERVLQRVTTE